MSKLTINEFTDLKLSYFTFKFFSKKLDFSGGLFSVPEPFLALCPRVLIRVKAAGDSYIQSTQ